jgi:hypothetical protein
MCYKYWGKSRLPENLIPTDVFHGPHKQIKEALQLAKYKHFGEERAIIKDMRLSMGS